ncbi:NUDIX hydrolase [Nocardioides campestrisoli]|uniref:NUDIX hydrolase n=1 Tax=Nocardioides campestrisoli TaxID=2736757 RepID=UPI0015E787E7|nr:NUDIX domain-containing protein [Nocardioides campestrisoli]
MTGASPSEQVALYGPDGRPTGEAADRARVRRDNLRHAATHVVVRNSDGLVYVHRRTATKDLYPGLYDFTAGGVLQAGEDPLLSATREVEEELGVSGARLVPLFEADYADDRARFHAYCFVCLWDGPIRWQPAEVAWGQWVTPARLLEMLDELEFMPDAVANMRPWLESLRQR